MNTSPGRASLRKQLRARRNALSPFEQSKASQALLKRLRSHPVFLRSKRIAFYLAADGEISPHALLIAAEKMGKECYLPVLNPFKHNNLWFVRYRSGDELLLNYFNILEPPCEKSRLPAWALDLVLMPLVGFDRRGNRLGMGGGFYDRTFAFKQRTDKKKSKSVVLIGLAHKCQEEAFLACEAWDIPLDYIATDQEVIKT